MARSIIICILFFIHAPAFAQRLTLDDLTYYLDPEHFNDSTLLAKKGFTWTSLYLLSPQEITYEYGSYADKKIDLSHLPDETLHYGLIDKDKPYRRFHVAYLFGCASQKPTYFIDQLRNLKHQRGPFGDSEMYENELYEFHVFNTGSTRCQVRVYGKKRHDLNNGRTKIPGYHDPVANAFVPLFKRISVEPFDANNLAVYISSNGRQGIINRQGELILEKEYMQIKHLEGTTYVVANLGGPGKTSAGLIDASGHEILPLEYEYIQLLKPGVVRLKKDGVESEMIIK